MRMRLGCVASLALASLSCNPRPPEPFPERLSCPTAHELRKDEGAPPPGCALFDTDHDKGYADLRVCVRVGPPIRTEVTTGQLSLSASGDVTGACFEPTVSDSVGASAVRALQRAAPFGSLIAEPESVYETKTESGQKVETKTEKLTPVENRAGCLAGRRVIASFTAR